MPELDLRQLKYFIAVAETGSITRAARRLTITQPALSRAIRALERTVGVPLLVRRSNASELTAAGSALLADAYELVGRSRAALERARATRSGVEALTVTVPVCDVVAVEAVSRSFEADRPGVRVNVVAREWPERPDGLRAAAADVSFLRDRQERCDLAVGRLAREPRMVLLRPDHPLAGRTRLTLSDLRDEPVTHWSGMSAKEADHWSGADVDGRPRRHGPLVRDATGVLAAVVLGRAVAFAHGSALPDAELPGLCVRPVEGLSDSCLEIGVPARGAKRVADAFVEHVRHRWPLPGHGSPGATEQ
ncbi:LysR family transcriptional regulator [Streptomyces sp. enrichment culture]|uniref:LysR family transcriptional regulator n=1 Tax=Streptomyces sp. enrichment culture TaxID=1795815 RepID=UPI003F56414A